MKIFLDMQILSNKDVKQLKEIVLRLDSMDGRLEEIKNRVSASKFVTPQLERAIRNVSRRAAEIDRKVEDE